MNYTGYFAEVVELHVTIYLEFHGMSLVNTGVFASFVNAFVL